MTGLGRFLAWLNKVEPVRDAPPPSARFDAIISVGPYNLPRGVAPDLAVAAIKRAVKALPGAAWVAVGHHPIGSAEGAIQVLLVDSRASAPADLQGQVERATAAAIRDLPCPPPAPPSLCKPSSPTYDEAMFPEIESGMEPAGWSDSQTFTPISLRDLATASTTGTVPDAGVAGAPGLQAVTDAELLAQVLTCVGITGAAEFAHRIIARFGSFAAVLTASEIELRKIPGLGTHSIAAIKLVHAMALRLSQAAIKNTPLLDRSDLLMRYGDVQKQMRQLAPFKRLI